MTHLPRVLTKRIYLAPLAADGHRVLVDRLWPRGVSRARAALDAWAREVAPSPELRSWFDHRSDRWTEFQARYFAELRERRGVVSDLLLTNHSTVTLLYAARDEKHNHARALQRFLVHSGYAMDDLDGNADPIDN